MPVDRDLRNWYRPEPASARELECVSALATGDYEVFSRKLEMICTEGREVFIRMAVAALAEMGDLSASIHTVNGDVACAAISLAMHLVMAQNGIKYILKYFAKDPTIGIKPGDIFYFNDARYGGVHSPDQIMVMPVFHKDELIAWVSSGSHENEVGANEAGGHSPRANNIYVDGLQLAPFKVGENYRLKNDLVELMANMIRTPLTQVLDVKAREASCEVMIKRLWGIVEEKGPGVLIGVMRKAIDESAEAARRRISALNDGTFRQIIWWDKVGHEKYGYVRVMVTIRKEGDHATIDWTGSSPRVAGYNLNTYPHAVIAQTACYFFQYLFADLKPNIGFFAPFDYVVPDGSIFDADRDDASSRGIFTGMMGNDAVHVSFEKMLFDSKWGEHLTGPWPMAAGFTLAGINQFGAYIVSPDQGQMNSYAPGGRRHSDGLDLCGFQWGYTGEFPEAEHYEAQIPVVCLFRNKWAANAFGMGKYRGGRGQGTAYMIHDTPAVECKFPSFWHVTFAGIPGLCGGYPGVPMGAVRLMNSNLKELLASGSGDVPHSFTELIEAVEARKIKAEKFESFEDEPFFPVQEGDLIYVYSYGGPGYGDVLDRPVELVAKDLGDGSLSPWYAENVFKVAFEPKTLEVDEEETKRMRSAERESRKQRGRPYDEFEREWLKQRPTDDKLQYYGKWPNVI